MGGGGGIHVCDTLTTICRPKLRLTIWEGVFIAIKYKLIFNVLMYLQSRICLMEGGLRRGMVAVIEDDDAHMDRGRWTRDQLVALIITTRHCYSCAPNC